MSTYSNISDIDQYAKDNGYGEWLNTGKADQLQILEQTTNDIEDFHEVPRDSTDKPFALGNIELNRICTIQALRNTRVFGERRMSEKASAASSGSFNTSAITINGKNKIDWEPVAKRRLKNWMFAHRIFKGQEFVRG